MQRIARRALALLICAVLFSGLIGAQPLTKPSAPADSAQSVPPAAAAQPSTTPPPTQQPSALSRVNSFHTMSIMAAPLPQPKAAPLPKPKPAPARIPGDGPAMRGSMVAQTERLDLYVGSNTFTEEQIADRAAKLERVLRAAEDYFGTTLKRRVSIGFYRKQTRRELRGMAFTDQGRVELYYGPDEDIGRATTVAMHELGHHLEAQRYGEAAQRRADTILHEGLATWIASIRWLDQCGAGSWRERAQQLHAAGVPQRLLTAEASGANNAYETWASFVDYLIRQYGWKKFNALYASGHGRTPGSADYEGVLGKPIDQLASDWRAWVNQ